MNIVLNPVLLIIVICLLFYWYLRKVTQTPLLLRGDFIREYQFPVILNQKLADKYPHLQSQQVDQIIEALRSYFQICNLAQEQQYRAAMPSVGVDSAWVEFISQSDCYEGFCEQAFGQYLYRSPAKTLVDETEAEQLIKGTFNTGCKLFNISLKAPDKLPPLFSVDRQLNIPDGFHYQLNNYQQMGLNLPFSHVALLSE